MLRLKSLKQLGGLDILHLEMADVIAWFFAVLNLIDFEFDFPKAFFSMFPGTCYKCGKRSCKCPEVEQEINLVGWRIFPTNRQRLSLNVEN